MFIERTSMSRCIDPKRESANSRQLTSGKHSCDSMSNLQSNITRVSGSNDGTAVNSKRFESALHIDDWRCIFDFPKPRWIRRVRQGDHTDRMSGALFNDGRRAPAGFRISFYTM
jgi:hypothetical protein